VPTLKRHYGLTEGSLSWVLLAIALGAVLSLLVAGKVVGSWGSRRTTQVTVCVMGGSLALALGWTPGPLLWVAMVVFQQVQLPQAQAAWGYAAFAGAMAVARLSGDAVRQHWDEARLLRVGGYLSAGAMACVLWFAHPGVAFLGFALMGAGLAMVVPMLYNAAARLPGLDRASAIATVSVIGYTGFLLGPPVIGTLAELSNLSAALSVLVPLSALLGWGARYLPRRKMDPGSSPG
jgi:MFS family permease